MKVRKSHGWRLYSVSDGEIGVGRLRRPKFFPATCPLNSIWLTRSEAATIIRANQKVTAP